MYRDIFITVRSRLSLAVSARIEGELSEQFSIFDQHADVEIGDEDQAA